MNDFELRRELRELRTPREPGRDLWTPISRQIRIGSVAPAAVSRRRWLPFAAAAGIAFAVSAGVFLLALQQQADPEDAGLAFQRESQSVREQIDHARELATTGDPRLASAEVVLDAANEELELAMQQRPDAVFLVGLLNRTHAQRRKLARLGLDAG